MRILRKTHFWQDKRTFLELNADLPFLENGFPKEGNVVIRIGENSNTKAAFKMGVDEARALRDILDVFLREHDTKMKDLYNSWTPSSPQSSRSQNNIVLNDNTGVESNIVTGNQQSNLQQQPYDFNSQQQSANNFSFNSTQQQKKDDFDIFGEKPKEDTTKLQPLF